MRTARYIVTCVGVLPKLAIDRRLTESTFVGSAESPRSRSSGVTRFNY